MKKYRDIVILGIAIFILLFFIGNICPIEKLFGIPCPGCNMFTALYWLCKGNVTVANWYHPVVIPLLIYALICAFLYVIYKGDMKKTLYFKASTIVFLTMFIGVYIIRMITIFPDIPMQFNEQAVFIKLFHLF